MWIILCLLTVSAVASERKPLAMPTQVQVHDESEIVKLAEEEKFRIPLSGRTISRHIEYTPENSGECEFIEPNIEYKSLAQSQAIFDKEDSIAAILPLKKREIVIVADPYYNVASYSIDRHFLMKPRLPKTSLIRGVPKDIRPVNPVLISTSNEEYVYLLSHLTSYVFHYNNIAAQTTEFKLEGSPTNVIKAIQHNGFIIICGGYSGIFVYKIQEPSMKLKLIQQINVTINTDQPVDMELNEDSQLLFVLNQQQMIDIYTFDPVGYLENPQKNQILKKYDQIDLQSITLNHKFIQASNNQLVGHINIQISRDRQEQALLVLFSHESRTLVAELAYNSLAESFSFVRYFKFSMLIKEIHTIQDVMVVVGDGLLGMFPYGVNPHLIVQEFNGFMTLTPIERIILTEAPFFVGVTKNEIEYGGIFLNNEAGINCHLSSSSQLKQVKFKANLTVCGDMYQPQVSKYCEYEKTFIIRQMEMTASAPVATSLWVATIVLTLLIVVGLCFLFAMHKKKEREIRKLELYFEEKRRSMEVPASSQRRK